MAEIREAPPANPCLPAKFETLRVRRLNAGAMTIAFCIHVVNTPTGLSAVVFESGPGGGPTGLMDERRCLRANSPPTRIR